MAIRPRRARGPVDESPFDLEADRLRAGRREFGPADPRPEVYLRLLANPFPAVLWIVVCSYAMQGAVAIKNLPFFGISVLAMTFAVVLFQYHCLDCGRTERLTLWPRHCCERVEDRRRALAPRRFRGPKPVAQTVLMVLAFGVFAVAVLIRSSARR